MSRSNKARVGHACVPARRRLNGNLHGDYFGFSFFVLSRSIRCAQRASLAAAHASRATNTQETDFSAVRYSQDAISVTTRKSSPYCRMRARADGCQRVARESCSLNSAMISADGICSRSGLHQLHEQFTPPMRRAIVQNTDLWQHVLVAFVRC